MDQMVRIKYGFTGPREPKPNRASSGNGAAIGLRN